MVYNLYGFFVRVIHLNIQLIKKLVDSFEDKSRYGRPPPTSTPPTSRPPPPKGQGGYKTLTMEEIINQLPINERLKKKIMNNNPNEKGKCEDIERLKKKIMNNNPNEKGKCEDITWKNVEKAKEEIEKNKEKKEEKQILYTPTLIINPNTDTMNRKYLKIIDTLYELADILNLTKYTGEEINKTPGVYLFDGLNHGYCLHEVILKTFSYLSTKEDIKKLETKVDKIIDLVNK